MQDGANAKQQIVERIKGSTNILVTVSSNPSVDELSAALGMTLMLNKMDKHATAVFSGAIPPAINFLDPSKTFENTVDSLRDFIIALDKEKADRLRYKVENDVVRIFITPYKTTITEKDLDFSQGDFNVETIVALGVEKREELDQAIVAHGRILHDATVITINAREDKSSLGSIDWQDPAASSLCEMLVGISESFQQPGLLDEQIATALLTGIVAATDRFSNDHTSPRVMTMSAQLMAAGANQQLIAMNLQQTLKIEQNKTPSADGSVPLAPDASAKVEKTPEAKKPDGEMQISHEEPEKPEAEKPEGERTVPEPDVAKQLDKLVAPKADFAELKTAIEDETKPPELPKVEMHPPEPAPSEPPGPHTPQEPPSWQGRRIEPPSLGGTLNATAEEAHESALRAEEDERNSKILSHDNPLTKEPVFKDLSKAAPIEPPKHDEPAPELPPLPPLPEPPPPLPEPKPPTPPPTPAPEPPLEPPKFDTPPLPPAVPPAAPASIPTAPTIAELEQKAQAEAAKVVPPTVEPPSALAAPANEPLGGDLDAARQAVNDALQGQPFSPANQPLQSVGATSLPLGSDLGVPAAGASGLSYEATAPSTAPPEPPTTPNFDLPPPPPLPDFSTLPPLPSEQPAGPSPVSQHSSEPMAPSIDLSQPKPASNDPGQFKIPGQ